MVNEFEKKLKKAKKAIDEVVKCYPSVKLEIHPTETMLGSIVNHIYLVDRSSKGKVWMQKHLLTVD